MRLLTRLLAVAAAVGAATLLVALGTLPPKAIVTSPRPGGRSLTTVPGAFHVHTRRSDGTGSTEEVARAAARAGLKWVLFTDHGDGTRPADAPRRLSGVLSVQGVEISTTAGHYIAIDMRPAPYPLAGEPSAVIEDVARLGGFGIAAHPGSPKPALRWREWTAPFDGLEWINADSEWRDERHGGLARALLHYPFRAPETLAALLDRPDNILARWDALTRRRRVVAIAGSDAHARIGFRSNGDPYEGTALIKLPSYEASFRTFSVRAEVEGGFTGDAACDAAGLIDALRSGHLSTSIDALASPPDFQFVARSGRFSARQGDELKIDGPIQLEASASVPPGASFVLFLDGRMAREHGTALQYDAPAVPGVFRVEVRLPGAPGSPPVPWILGNPIYARLPGASELPRSRPQASTSLPVSIESGQVEHAPGSTAIVEGAPPKEGAGVTLRYRLAPGALSGQYAALVVPIDSTAASYDRISFRARGDRPLRISVQVRVPSAEAQRWQRSVYLDETPRAVTIFFDEMKPIGGASTWRPQLANVHALLFVIDTTNTVPGASGSVWIDDLRLER